MYIGAEKASNNTGELGAAIELFIWMLGHIQAGQTDRSDGASGHDLEPRQSKADPILPQANQNEASRSGSSSP